MEKIIRYKSLDNTIFDDEQKCINYDNLIKKVRLIMIPLGDLPKDESCKFANGQGYLQHNIKDVSKAKKELTDLANNYFKTNYGFGFIGRVMNDSNNSVLYFNWGRLNCIDEKGREWGQQYYAINPEKGKQIQFIDE